MMSLSVWLLDPCFFQVDVSVQGGLCQEAPSDIDPLYGEERVVRILLECFLVSIYF